MADSTDDFDSFIVSLSRELGSDTVSLLSAREKVRPTLPADALAQYAATLFGFFVAGFVAGLSKWALSEASAYGKKQVEKLKEALRKSPAAAHDAVQETASQPELVAATKEAAHAGQAEVAAQLVALGMDAAEAREKSEKLVQLVLGTLRP